MSGLENSVQQAVYSALTGSTALDALLARFYDVGNETFLSRAAIYDDVPQIADSGNSSFFPYVSIGDDTVTDWSTDTASGGEVTVTVHSWSRYAGRKEVKQVMEAIYNALHRATLTAPGFEFVGCDFEFSETVLDPDTETRHGIQRFRLLLDESGYGE